MSGQSEANAPDAVSGLPAGTDTGSAVPESWLIASARISQANAHAPYSNFRVGASIETVDGVVFSGCNVENASYPAGVCAERGALAAAIASGARKFSRIVIVTDADEPSPPCGICRQALVEFAPALEVISVAARGRIQRWSLADLLPSPFSPSSLAHA